MEKLSHLYKNSFEEEKNAVLDKDSPEVDRPTLPAPLRAHEMDLRLTLDREHLENSSSKKSLKGAGGQSKCSYIEEEAFSSPMPFVPGLGWLLSM